MASELVHPYEILIATMQYASGVADAASKFKVGRCGKECGRYFGWPKDQAPPRCPVRGHGTAVAYKQKGRKARS